MRRCKELETGNCSICGDHIGKGFDHTECSKIKKEFYGERCETKHPRKKLSIKQADRLAVAFRGL